MWYHKGPENWGSNLIQCWFPGYHAHIGGGTVKDFLDESSIDDITLAWMVDQTSDFLTYNDAEIKRFVEKQKTDHKWGEGALTDSASYAFLVPGAGGWKTRTPGEYRVEVPQAENPKKNGPKPKPEYYSTNEFIHPSVRYRMGLMKTKPEDLGTTPGWVWGKSPVGKYEPAALKGFVPTFPDDVFHECLWKRPAQKKGEEDVVIREYKINPSWDGLDGGFWASSEGLERQIVPAEIMKEFDQENGFLTPPPPSAPQTGFQPPQ